MTNQGLQQNSEDVASSLALAPHQSLRDFDPQLKEKRKKVEALSLVLGALGSWEKYQLKILELSTGTLTLQVPRTYSKPFRSTSTLYSCKITAKNIRFLAKIEFLDERDAPYEEGMLSLKIIQIDGLSKKNLDAILV